MAEPLITGAVLAGGRSRRLGRDKVLLRLAGKPLAAWVMDALRVVAPDSWLVTNQPLAHLSLGYPSLCDLWPGRGALGGLLSVMLLAQSDWILLAACDTPFLQPDLLRAMLQTAHQGGGEAVVCRSSRGLEPLPGLFHRRLQPRLQKQVEAGVLPVRTLLAACRTSILPPAAVHHYDPQERSFFNINTPQDLAAALAKLLHKCCQGRGPG
ncbi:MAG: molybdenum cofactor guanylyltransferase, partial [Desulfobacca sp.]|uniref:molybdenum cofactor guanylyltransferase n=1 Tax=Desulfobacca sp. TaxID=2067990 RepID=UPI004048EFF9